MIMGDSPYGLCGGHPQKFRMMVQEKHSHLCVGVVRLEGLCLQAAGYKKSQFLVCYMGSFLKLFRAPDCWVLARPSVDGGKLASRSVPI